MPSTASARASSPIRSRWSPVRRSETTSSVPAWTPRSAAMVNRAADSISTARTPRRSSGEPVRRRGRRTRRSSNRPDSDGASRAPSQRGRRRAAAPSLPSASGARRPRNAASSRRAGTAVRARTRSPRASSGCRAPQVPTRRRRRTPSWTSSSTTIAVDGASHAGCLYRHGLAVERPGEAEQPALAVHLPRGLEKALGDAARPQRISGQEARLCVVAWVCPEVDRHRRTITRSYDVPLCAGYSSRRPSPTSSRSVSEEPVERVFLEDVARRGLGRFARSARRRRSPALCHVGANLVPSGTGVAGVARKAARSSPRMMVGEEEAVTELWEAIRKKLPRPLDDRPGQPVFVITEAPTPADTGLRAAKLDDLDLLVPACAAAYHEEVGIDALARDAELFAGGRAARSSSGAAGSGSTVGAYASRRKRRPGRHRRSSSSRSGWSRSCEAAGMPNGR